LVDHATPDQSFAELGLSSPQIAETVLQAFFKKQAAALV
jgi:1-deoxy-D-xylulose-5-phosphate synthase